MVVVEELAVAGLRKIKVGQTLEMEESKNPMEARHRRDSAAVEEVQVAELE